MIRKEGSFGNHFLLVPLIVVILVPLAYMFLIALTPRRFLFRTILPSITLENFAKVLSDFHYQRFILNSWIICIVTTALTLILASLAGYGLSRFRFKGGKYFVVGILLTQMLPMEVLAISYYRIISALKLYNTLFGLILLDATITVPFCTLILKGMFDRIPTAIEEAAMIDGCSTFSSFLRVILPLSRSGLFAAAVFTFLQVWAEYLYALIFTQDYRSMTLTVGLAQQIGQHVTNWNIIMALACVAGMPVLVIFGLTQRVFIKGLTAGAIK